MSAAASTTAPPTAAANAAAVAAAIAASATPRTAPIFAVTPALIGNRTVFLDWSKAENTKLYHKAVEKLSVTFGGKGDQVLLLNQSLKDRAAQCGWDTTILTIPDSDNVNRNIISEHGLITYENIRDWANVNIIGQHTRAAQDSNMMYQCLYNSTTDDVKKKILLKTSKYQIGTTSIGPAFLKVLIGTAEVETKATVAYIRRHLMNLETKMAEMHFNIDNFHEHVNMLMTTLASHGKSSDDLIIYLFDSYLSVPDKDFHDLITSKRSNYHMGVIDLSGEELLQFAQTCYDVREGDQKNPWLQKSVQQQEIEALTAELTNVKSKQLAGDTKTTKKTKKPEERMKGGFRDDSKYAWKKVKPKTGEKLTKMVNGKEYRWCSDHVAWVLHSEASCKMRLARVAKESARNKKATTEAHDAEVSDEEDDNTLESAAMKSFAAALAMGDD